MKTLIEARSLRKHLRDPDWAILDCRFYLAEPDRGESEYLEGHIEGAVYAHLDRDLSAPLTGTNGRHPLPSVDRMAATFSSFGIDPETQVVAYDTAGGQIAARLWWMLRYLGHDRVAVLDGGLDAFLADGGALKPGRETREPRSFEAKPRDRMRIDVDRLTPDEARRGLLLLDARAAERYRGETEPLDPVAGHIPGARNHPTSSNLGPDGRFADAETLRDRFRSVIGGTAPESVVSYCGSGVTACHNLLAMEVAGIEGAKLYPGSWSEWCADPRRPVATGDA